MRSQPQDARGNQITISVRTNTDGTIFMSSAPILGVKTGTGAYTLQLGSIFKAILGVPMVAVVAAGYAWITSIGADSISYQTANTAATATDKAVTLTITGLAR